MLETLRALGNLKARFPAFRFRIICGHQGRHQFEAVRKDGPGHAGLYALISADPAEMVDELTADELRRAA